MIFANEILSTETPVTDYLYDEKRAHHQRREAFFSFLKPDQPPRKGDNVLVSAEEWQEKLCAFGEQTGILFGLTGSVAEKATFVRDQIFGEPCAIKAGGALANSFDAMVKATIDGAPLTDGVFVTAVGEGISGQVFADSLSGKLLHPEPRGWQLEAHVFPVEGDRIMLSIPSFCNPPSDDMSPEQFDLVPIDASTKRVMLGGYLKYTGKYDAFLDKILEKVAEVSLDPDKRPSIVLTAASQDIAESDTLRRALQKASRVSRVVVCANTGEFRRLVAMDTAWRKAHDHKWIGLEGAVLENAKQSDAAYSKDKASANEAAYVVAYHRFCKNKLFPVTFVVTGGKAGVRVVNEDGVSELFRTPKAPHGVVNTVGGGDGFAGGFLLGHIKDLPLNECVELGFVCAGEIIGRDDARLVHKTETKNIDGRDVELGGVLAYLDPQKELHAGLLQKLIAGQKAAPVRTMEAQRGQKPSVCAL